LVVSGQTDAFSGPISILVDEASASTSEIFAQGMRDLGRASVVGVQTSAGMALPSVIESLPDGGALQLVVGHHHGPSQGAPEGRGVQLDGVLFLDQAAYRDHDDPVRNAAVRWMRRRSSPSVVD
jgi:carboxyl-terminal processing protease